MKRVVCSVLALIGWAASPAPACDRVFSYAPAATVAVPVFVADHCAAPVALVAPVVEPVVFVQRPLFVPRARVQVFSQRNRVRLFVR